MSENDEIVRWRKIVADNVRRIRKSNGISQQELAELTDLHRTSVVRFENYKRSISLDTLIALARGLDIDPRDLLEPPSERQ